MTDRCLSLDDLLVRRMLPVDDSRRCHLDRCPRCQALLANYDRFTDSGPVPADADLARVSAELERFIATDVTGAAGDDPVVQAPQAARGRTRRPKHLRPWFGAAAAAVLLLLLVSPALRRTPDPGAPSDLRRGGGTHVRGVPTRLQATRLASDRMRLTWEPVLDPSVSYNVVFYGSDLRELTRIATGSLAYLDFDPEAANGLGQAAELWWAVAVEFQGDELGVSPVQSLVVP
ncbi:MAG: hypothetical protein GY838_04245 [bacterium]|nr:hypothetical protein [bacterium]